MLLQDSYNKSGIQRINQCKKFPQSHYIFFWFFLSGLKVFNELDRIWQLSKMRFPSLNQPFLISEALFTSKSSMTYFETARLRNINLVSMLAGVG